MSVRPINDESEYQELILRARTLLKQCQEFPAHELMTYAEKHHPEDRSITSLVWALYCEAGDA